MQDFLVFPVVVRFFQTYALLGVYQPQLLLIRSRPLRGYIIAAADGDSGHLSPLGLTSPAKVALHVPSPS